MADLFVGGKKYASDISICRQYLFFLGFFSKLLHRQTSYSAKLKHHGIRVIVPLPFLSAVWKELSGRDAKTGHVSIVRYFPSTSKEDPVYQGMTRMINHGMILLTVKIAKEILCSDEAVRVRKSRDSRSAAFFAWKLFSTIRPYNERNICAIRLMMSRARVFSNISSCTYAIGRLATEWGFSPQSIVSKYLEKASAPYRKDIGIDGLGTTPQKFYAPAPITLHVLPPFPALKDEHVDLFDCRVDGFVVDQIHTEEHELSVHERAPIEESILPIREHSFLDLLQSCPTSFADPCFYSPDQIPSIFYCNFNISDD